MNVNENAKETVDTIDYVWQWLLTIWDSFTVELKVFVLCIFTISVLMQWVKKALLVNKTKRERIRQLWVISLPLGVVIALIGRLLSGEMVSDGYWAVIGLTVGTTAMGVHYITMKMVWPLVMFWWGRVKLFLRGVPDGS